MKNATELADRADAVAALAKLKGDDDVVAALADALRNDKAWGIRANAADALGQLGGPAASKQLLDALNTAKEPWVRNRIVSALANFKDDSAIVVKLNAIAGDDSSYRARAAALQALPGRLSKPPAPSPRSMPRSPPILPTVSCATPRSVPWVLSVTTKPCRSFSNGRPQASPSIRATLPSPAWLAFKRATRTSPSRSHLTSASLIFPFAWPASSLWVRAATQAPFPLSKPFSRATTSASKWSP